ncbi:MAG: AMP-binding protein [Acidocella sp.]|nr:AMP-binding protein [Acidocella sp.]
MNDSEPLPDYHAAYAGFNLPDLLSCLSGAPDTGYNACVECCDRHAARNPDAIALDWEDQSGARAQYSFANLRDDAARFANLLTAQGIKPGDVVAGMLPRIPELLVCILGAWRAGAVYQPFFTAFGPSAIEHRLKTSQARLMVTDLANIAKLDGIAPRPRAILIAPPEAALAPGDINLHMELARFAPDFTPVLRRGEEMFMLMSTSGTTGLPKGVPVPLNAMPAFYIYMRDAIGLRASDKFWNIADPGWAYGLYYAVIGPLLLGHATTLYNGPFTAQSTYRIIASHGITNLAGSPTAFRMLIAAGAPPPGLKSRLRAVSSAGEPLNPEVIRWFAAELGAPIYDHYGQTELGMVVNNHHALDHEHHAGAAGFPMPGYRVAVLDDHDAELPANAPGTLAVDIARSPLLWFRGYLNQPTSAIANGYYRTGDMVEMSPTGYVSFVGRNDDVITSSGYRIGPFDVESALLEHPAVIEAAVIGKPDPERTEIVKAFVVLAPGFEATDGLAEALRLHVRHRLSAHAYPREIAFIEQLPKTPSGKIQRFVLRQGERKTAAF